MGLKEKIFYPKYLRDANNMQKLKFIEKRHMILLCEIIFVTIMALYLCYLFIDEGGLFESLSSYKSPEKQELVNKLIINYTDLSKEDQKFFYNLLIEINSLYLERQKEIIVSYDLEDICDCENLEGVNKRDGEKIFIKFRRNKDFLKEVITHEFLHSYIKADGGDTLNHAIVYDLGKKMVAFDE